MIPWEHYRVRMYNGDELIETRDVQTLSREMLALEMWEESIRTGKFTRAEWKPIEAPKKLPWWRFW